MIQEAIYSLTQKKDLTPNVAEAVMDEIMSGKATPAQMAGYLIALSMKGESITEITESAKVMRNHAVKLPQQPETLEIVGTGGDKSNSFNISTTSAIVLAGAGIPIAKHGNRASSSQCGSADVLESLGVKIDIEPEKSLEILKEIGICFLFAQKFHSSMKYVAPVRREMGVRTIFNILGPLTNPLGATMQLLGVYDESLINPLAQVLMNLGVKSAMVVHGTDGLDEISLTSPTKVREIRGNNVKDYLFQPEDYGYKLCKKEDLVGGTPTENAEITRSILSGEKSHCRNAVVLNAGAALYLTRDDLSLKDAMIDIESVLDSGKAMEKLETFIKVSNS